MYKEWTSAFRSWACPDEAANYTVAPFYQRLDPSAPRFVPNFANEAGVYLKFVVDHYWHLPELTAFVQADAGNEHLHYAKSGVRGVPVSRRIGSLNVAAIREAGVGYLPLADLALQRATSLLEATRLRGRREGLLAPRGELVWTPRGVPGHARADRHGLLLQLLCGHARKHPPYTVAHVEPRLSGAGGQRHVPRCARLHDRHHA